VSGKSNGRAEICVTSGIARWNRVSKQAAFGRLGNSSASAWTPRKRIIEMETSAALIRIPAAVDSKCVADIRVSRRLQSRTTSPRRLQFAISPARASKIALLLAADR